MSQVNSASIKPASEQPFKYLIAIILMALGGCTTHSLQVDNFAYDANLIDGKSLFGHTVQPAAVQNILTVSAEMRAFASTGLERKSEYARFRTLMKRLKENQFFVNQYDYSATYPADKTFALRRGNCVSYTTLFIALAREAGLKANYQMIRSKPTWNVESGYLIKNNHINVIIEDVFIPGYLVDGITVDFNSVQPDEDESAKKITDDYALTLYYGNRAIDYLYLEDYESSFAYLKRAILTEPTNPDLWNNLGSLYSILESPKLSEQAFFVALQLDDDDETAISGVARSLEKQGRLVDGEVYARRVRRYQQRNAFYHFAVAQDAYVNQLFPEALDAVSQAIALKKKSKFYALQAAVARQLGDEVLVEKSVRLQRKYLQRSIRPSFHRSVRQMPTSW